MISRLQADVESKIQSNEQMQVDGRLCKVRNDIGGVSYLSNLKALKIWARFLNFHPQPDRAFYQAVDLVVKGRQNDYTKIIPIVNVIEDLSSNSLTGEVPNEMANLSALGSLNLSRNHQEGYQRILEACKSPIPLTKQFQTFNDPSIYMGNADLCSPPLTTKCSSDLRNAGVEDGEVEDEDGSEELLFLFEHGTRIHYWILDFLWSFENQKLLEKCPILSSSMK
ncbi:Leucine Rich Repeat family protein expressed [Citrus sinensis]|uniref:Leucine Rich Repeat family protein expressed n=1 Tax=Citrus sinensis TaxID=2711 RepID=A0ACB8LHY7_CITSI|nr:Leucine Rich Repeat family protein expressed [Citrus sinensis]